MGDAAVFGFRETAQGSKCSRLYKPETGAMARVWPLCGSAHALHMHIPVPFHAETLVCREGAVGTAETTRWLPLICTNTRDNKCVWNLATGVLASIITIASLCLQCMCFSACYFPFPIFERKRSILCFIWPFSSIFVVPFVLQNQGMLKETWQLFAPVAARYIAYNKTEAGKCNLIQYKNLREDAWKKATNKGEALIHAVSFLSLQRWTNAREGRGAEDSRALDTASLHGKILRCRPPLPCPSPAASRDGLRLDFNSEPYHVQSIDIL